MQNRTTTHASVALLAVLALVFFGGEANDLGPLTDGIDALCEQVAKVVHVEFWTRLVGVPEVN